MRIADNDRKLLWIVWECIKGTHGWPLGTKINQPQQAAFYASIGTDAVQAARLKGAHLDRHIKSDPVAAEMSGGEMRTFLENCLRAWVDRVVPR